jgi:hypothetical protein
MFRRLRATPDYHLYPISVRWGVIRTAERGRPAGIIDSAQPCRRLGGCGPRLREGVVPWCKGGSWLRNSNTPTYQARVCNGTTSRFAALDLASGPVIAQHYRRHRHQEFLRFLKLIDAAMPVGRDLHLVLDNYATDHHAAVQPDQPQRGPAARSRQLN